jgi:hypothetical protein
MRYLLCAVCGAVLLVVMLLNETRYALATDINGQICVTSYDNKCENRGDAMCEEAAKQNAGEGGEEGEEGAVCGGDCTYCDGGGALPDAYCDSFEGGVCSTPANATTYTCMPGNTKKGTCSDRRSPLNDQLTECFCKNPIAQDPCGAGGYVACSP